MAAMQIFVSHSHEDSAFCVTLVKALREAGADVWYDEDNLGPGQLMEVVQRELGRRPVFIVILTKHAFASGWVKNETTWAFKLYNRDPTRIILPVTAGQIELADFDPAAGWLFLDVFKRIEDASYRPLPLAEAVRRTLHALALTPRGAAPEPTAPQAGESAEDLIARGRALRAQKKHAEALPLFQRATELAPQSSAAWFQLGYTLNELKQFSEGLAAYDRALAIDPASASIWENKGNALLELKRYKEALAAFDHILAIDPNVAHAWNGRGIAWLNLMQYEKALTAFDQALAINPISATTWYNKGVTLRSLKEYEEALIAYDHALAIDPNVALAWQNKAIVLRALGRETDAQECEEHARALGG